MSERVTVFVEDGVADVKLNRPEKMNALDSAMFEALVGTWPLVRECHMLAGETDFLLKVVAHDWDAYQKFLTTNLTPAPNVSHVKSALAIRSSKQLPGVPIEVEEPKPARTASGG